MKFLRQISQMLRNSCKMPMLPRNITYNSVRKRNITTGNRFLSSKTHVLMKQAEENSETETDSEDPIVVDDELADLVREDHVSVKETLFPKSRDPFILRLNFCASISEVFEFFDKNCNKFRYQHLAQMVLVLWDFQKMYYHINIVNNAVNLDFNQINLLGKDFIEQLENKRSFTNLLELIKKEIKNFDLDSLSCILLYLNKMGLKLQNETTQLIIDQMKLKLKQESFSLSTVSRLIVVLFSEANLGSFFVIQDFIPIILSKIGTCEKSEDFKLLTICLLPLHYFVREEDLNKYKLNLKTLIGNGVLNSDQYRTILKVILFLNHPSWRDSNLMDINNCIKILVNHLHKMNISELLCIYDVFYKNQEPSIILSELQRCASRYLHQLEEESSPLLDVRIKLLQCIFSFATPLNRPQYTDIIKNYLEYPLSGTSLMELYKIVLYTKTSNFNICKSFWDKLLAEMIKDPLFRKENLLRICSNYINFYQDVNQYRNFYFEKKVNVWIEEEVERSVLMHFNSYLSNIASFLIVFGRNENILMKIVSKLEENQYQLNHIEIYNLAKSLSLSLKLDHFEPIYERVKRIVINYLDNNISKEASLNVLNLQMKSAIFLNDENGRILAENISQKISESKSSFSSKIIKNLSFSLYSIDVLIPEVVDKMIKYIIDNKEYVLGYNAEKVIYLCYYLGYKPKNSLFFDAVIDIILRDQERMSGLSYLQACLALCYFDKLPDSFIRQIFNVYFLEKLDTELSNCYYKDKYPVRVRHRMMQLNRAVCLGYPQFNVPWFHQKYIEETKSKLKKEKEDYDIANNIKLYIKESIENNNLLYLNVIIPYGYLIDYVIYFNQNQELVSANSPEIVKRLAILIMRNGSSTRINEQLKGQYHLKIRHLEILGYTTILISYLDWANLTTAEDKISYLKNKFLSESYNLNEINR